MLRDATSAPSLAAVQEVAKSKVPTLGYGSPTRRQRAARAVGAVIVALMQREGQDLEAAGQREEQLRR